MKNINFKKAFIIGIGLTFGYEVIHIGLHLVYSLLMHCNFYWHIF